MTRNVSVRAFCLTVGIFFVVSLLATMLSMGREWRSCVASRMAQAELAAVLPPGPNDHNHVEAQTRDALLRLSGTVAFRMIGGGADGSLFGPVPALDGSRVDFDQISLIGCIWRATQDVLGFGGRYLQVTATFPLRPNARIEIVIRQHAMIAHLRRYMAQMLALSMAVSLTTGILLYVARDRLTVKPMRILTANIVALRRDPEYARLSGLKWLSTQNNEQISEAARELLIMQDELRIALWRNAQLAALGTAVAKISHDLRNILASALLVAGRLQENPDPAIKRAGKTLVPSIERAVDLVIRVMAYGGGRAPPVTRNPVKLREVVDEAAESIQRGEGCADIENRVPQNLVLPLDRNQIFRVVANLLRNATEAGARQVSLMIEYEGGTAQLVVADDGRGLPRKALAGLFQPFTGSGRNGGTGLGLAIARDLVRAHGGDLLLRKTGPAGTVFVMSLPMVDEPAA